MAIVSLAGAVFILSTTTATAKDVQYEVRVDGMTCPFCAATSEKALRKIKGVTAVSTDLTKATISVCAASDTLITDEKLSKMLKKKGFTYVSKTKLEACALDVKKKPQKTGFFQSIFHKHS